MADMKKSLREAGLLRNLIETCLQASSNPMTGRELFEWPSIAEHLGKGLAAYSRFSTQLRSIVSKGRVEQIGKGATTTYRWVGAAPSVLKPTAINLPELKIRINKADHTLRLVFEGLAITLEVL